MKAWLWLFGAGVLAACTLSWPETGTAYAQVVTVGQGAIVPAGMDILTRGPIHEALAEPINSGSVQPLIVPRQPPAPINEVPSAERPDDPNAVWIGGYWAWDNDRNDFLWVSGIWRVPPPGQEWVAGYWAAAGGGYQWVPGFWWPATEEQITYYPPPPPSQDQGPPDNPPNPDDFWIPGYWQWSDTGYAWAPGQWAQGQPGWMWVPNSYYWSPQGWVFRDGYWDYPLLRRGLEFAPVLFTNSVYTQPRFVYSPSVVIDPGVLPLYLFVRPAYAQYYFGDYFAPRYEQMGIFPWFNVFQHGHYAYDPLFSYYNWHYRARDPQWQNNLLGWFNYYRAHPDRRPPHSLAQQRQILARAANRPDRSFLAIGHTLQNWARRPNNPVRLSAVTPEERARYAVMARRTRESERQRAQLETRGVPGIAAVPGRPSQRPAVGAPKTPHRVSVAQLPKVGPSEARAPRVATRPREMRPGETARPGAGVPSAEQRRPQPRPGFAPRPTPGQPFTPGVTPRPAHAPQPGAPPRPEHQRGPRPGATRQAPGPREANRPAPSPRFRQPEPGEIRRPAPPSEARRPAPAPPQKPQGPPQHREREHREHG